MTGERAALLLKLKALKPELTARLKLSDLRAFDPVAIGMAGPDSIGVLVAYAETPSLFDISALQNELESSLDAKVHLAVDGMIEPAWESRIRRAAMDI